MTKLRWWLAAHRFALLWLVAVGLSTCCFTIERVIA